MLAGKEVKRAKLRFGLLSGAVGLLVFLILFQQALLGSLLLSFTGALENQSGTVLVFSEEARKNVSGSVILPPQQAQIAAVDGVGASRPAGRGHLHHRGRRRRHRRLGVRLPARRARRAHPHGRGPPAHHADRGGRLQGGRVGRVRPRRHRHQRRRRHPPHHRRAHRAQPLLGGAHAVGHLRRLHRAPQGLEPRRHRGAAVGHRRHPGRRRQRLRSSPPPSTTRSTACRPSPAARPSARLPASRR